MTHRLFSSVFSAMICLAVCFLYGCSDNTVRTVVSEDGLTTGSESSYFLPLTEGFTVVYQVTYADGTDETIELKVGKQVQLGTVSVYEWFSDDGVVRDTGYIRTASDAVFFYDGADADPEKILGFPLVAGASWLRFSETYGDDLTDIIAGTEDDSTVIPEGVSAKTFPSTGANVMTVIGEDELMLGNGDLLSGTFKVYNEGTTPGKKNYYWYAENIGLVKYIIGTTDGSYPRGDVVGEMVDFGN